MNVRRSPSALLLVLACIASPGVAQEPTDTGQVERVDVNLVLVDAVVVDRKGRTVSGLTRDDFQLVVQGRAQPIDTFDVACPTGADDPSAIDAGQRREAGPVPSQPRRIALVFDYYHMPLAERNWAMNWAKIMMLDAKTPAEEVMIVALADGVRIEQRFTSDPRVLFAALERMEHDTSLWAREFQPLTERSFFDNLTTVMDVLSFTEGQKAVVLFSGFYGPASAQDTWYLQVAERSAEARAAIYPADIYGLHRGPAGGSGALARLASESGGRTTHRTNDMSLAYARAQHDLACRYTLGFYVEPGEGRKRRQTRVRVAGNGRRVQAPEWVRIADERDRRESMLRAAFADPEMFDSPLLRLTTYPMRPAKGSAWETIGVLHFPVPVQDEPIGLDVAATLTRGATVLGKFTTSFEVPPGRGLPGNDRPVTLVFDRDLKPGVYRLTTLLTPTADRDRVHAATAKVTIPEVPGEGLIVRGPVLARALEEGLLLRAVREGFEEVAASEPLRRIIGDEGSFEPLVVYAIDPDDRLLAAWSICTVDRKWSAPAGSTIERSLIDRADGTVVHPFDPIPIGLPDKGKARCQSGIDELPSGRAAPGKYHVELVVRDPEGRAIGRGIAPLRVSGD